MTDQSLPALIKGAPTSDSHAYWWHACEDAAGSDEGLPTGEMFAGRLGIACLWLSEMAWRINDLERRLALAEKRGKS